MPNYVLQNRKELKKNHYIRKASPGAKYWFDFSAAPLQKYVDTRAEDFCLVIAGDEDIDSDFYAIPYLDVKHLFATNTFKTRRDGREAWIGHIEQQTLYVRGASRGFSVGSYYGKRELLDIV